MAKGIPVSPSEPFAVVGRVFATPYIEIPGIATASAYTAADAFGTDFFFDVPTRGVIETAILLDFDDEGTQVDLWLFRSPFVITADHDEFAVTDADLLLLEVVIEINNFTNANANQVGINNGLNLPYIAPLGKLYCQCVTRSTPTIAVANLPRVALRGLNYE